MPVGLPVVWSDDCLLHRTGGEVWIGLPAQGDEVPGRIETIRRELLTADARLVQASEHADDAVLAVHDEALVDFLRHAWDAWEEAGYPEDPGQDRVVPYIFPHPGLVQGIEPLVPVAASARTGAYAFDTMTPIGPGTWPAARAAVDCALTACDLVLGGTPLAYACTRPPGHHVTRSAYGGSCYLNNAAIAAQALRDGGMARVAIVDIDAHHGNGAQAIFWDRGDVFTSSVHVDPAAGWFPHFLGLETERGGGEGYGANVNVPLAPGTADGAWLAAIDSLTRAVRSHGSAALVLALGVDAAAGDPNSPLAVTANGFRRAGVAIGQLGLPTVVLQEGGYDLDTIGDLVLAALKGLRHGLDEAGTADRT